MSNNGNNTEEEEEEDEVSMIIQATRYETTLLVHCENAMVCHKTYYIIKT